MKRKIAAMLLTVALLGALVIPAGAQSYQEETVYAYSYVENSGEQDLLLLLGVPLAGSAVVCLILYSQMKSVHKQSHAGAYMTFDETCMTLREDHFTHRTISRRKIENKSQGKSR